MPTVMLYTHTHTDKDAAKVSSLFANSGTYLPTLSLKLCKYLAEVNFYLKHVEHDWTSFASCHVLLNWNKTNDQELIAEMSFIFFQLVKHLFDFELLYFPVIIIVSLNSLFFLPHQNITVKSGKSAIQFRDWSWNKCTFFIALLLSFL